MRLFPLFPSTSGRQRASSRLSGLLGVALLAAITGCSASSPEDDFPAGTNQPVQTPGKPFAVKLRFDTAHDCAMRYHWQDFRGEALSEPATLPLNRDVTLNSVEGASGYLGLVLTTDCPDLDDEEGFAAGRRELGFAMLSSPPRSLRARGADSPFGMVHGLLDDEWLGPWIKTLTWHTTDAKWWRFEMERRRASGFIELPMISGEFWDSDDSRPITRAELDALASRAADYFKAWPDGRYWELGLEENLEPRFRQPYYWKNLEAKAAALRKAAKKHAPGTKFIYQIANLEIGDIDAFAASDAARQFDILSLHPYAWPDFPSPDRWLEDYLEQVRSVLRSHGLTLPIWFTEVGAPHHGNGPGLFFGYPDTQAHVTGLTRYQAVNYMLKIHAIALHAGVQKLFWYNYRDRGIGNDYAENFFGTIDYWGYPRPVRVAYARMLSCLDGFHASDRLTPGRDIVAYRFSKNGGNAMLVWKRSAGATRVRLSRLGIDNADEVWIGDPMGGRFIANGGQLRIGEEPVWIATGSAIADCRLDGR